MVHHIQNPGQSPGPVMRTLGSLPLPAGHTPVGSGLSVPHRPRRLSIGVGSREGRKASRSGFSQFVCSFQGRVVPTLGCWLYPWLSIISPFGEYPVFSSLFGWVWKTAMSYICGGLRRSRRRVGLSYSRSRRIIPVGVGGRFCGPGLGLDRASSART